MWSKVRTRFLPFHIGGKLQIAHLYGNSFSCLIRVRSVFSFTLIFPEIMSQVGMFCLVDVWIKIGNAIPLNSNCSFTFLYSAPDMEQYPIFLKNVANESDSASISFTSSFE